MTISTNSAVLVPAPRSSGWTIKALTPSVAESSFVWNMAGVLEDALLLVVVVLLFPLGILLIGTPIALCVRVVLEIIRRL